MIKILGELKRCVIVLLLLCCAALCIIGGAMFAQATANNADNTDTPLTLNETSFIFNEDKTEILGLTEQTKEKIKALSSRQKISIGVPDTVTKLGASCYGGDELDAWGIKSKLDTVRMTSDSLVREIEEFAFFGCTGLRQVFLSGQVQTIGNNAFAGCENLKDVRTYANNPNFRNIGSGILYEIGLNSSDEVVYEDIAVLPPAVETIMDFPFAVDERYLDMFAELKNLTSVSIVSEVNEVYFDHGGALYYKENGKLAFLPASAHTIKIPKACAIDDELLATLRKRHTLSSLSLEAGYENYSVKNGILYNADETEIVFVPTGIVSARIVDTVTVIHTDTFAACTSLRDLYIPAGLTKVEADAFIHCNALKNVYVQNLSDWEKIDFSSVIDETTLTLHTGNPLSNGASLWLPGGGENWYVVTDLVLNGDSVGAFAFVGCGGLRTVTVTDKVKSIGQGAFAYCSKLENIILPPSITSLQPYTFAKCETLRSIDLPDSVTVIEKGAFAGCSSLVSVTLPSDLRQIAVEGPGAFSGCDSLKTIALPDTEDGESYRNGLFGNVLPEGMSEDTLFVAPSRAAYDALPSEMRTRTETSTMWSRVFFETNITFELYIGTESRPRAVKTERKLASAVSEADADVHYEYVTLNATLGYWAKNPDYRMPRVIEEYIMGSADYWKYEGAQVSASQEVRLIREEGEGFIFQTTLGAGDIHSVRPVDLEKVYDGEAWLFNSMSMEITDIRGEGYTYAPDHMPVNAGVYTVTVQLKPGYEWGDGTRATELKTFTLTIHKREVSLEWWYMYGGNPQNDTMVTGTVPYRAYNGAGTRSYMRAEFEGAKGRVVIDYQDMILQDETGNGNGVILLNAGLYTFLIKDQGFNNSELENYTFENAEQQFRITPYKIDLSDFNNMKWGLAGYGSDLRDGTLFIYDGLPYLSQQFGTPEDIRTVVRSYARQRKDATGKELDITIEINNIPMAFIGAERQYSARYSGDVTRSAVGEYKIQAAIKTLNGNYNFVFGRSSDLWSRGINIEVSDDGLDAIVEKVWYIAEVNNGLLSTVLREGDRAAEYNLSLLEWTFGSTTATVGGQTYDLSTLLAPPRLEHGDEDSQTYLNNDLVTFRLYRWNDEAHRYDPIGRAFERRDFNEYLNATMPVGTYKLDVTVHECIVDGEHVHWWDYGNSSLHQREDQGVAYQGFVRTFEFNVLPAEIEFVNESALTVNGKPVTFTFIENGKAQFFGNLFTPQIRLVNVDPQGIWTEYENLYDGADGAEISFNLYRMKNNHYRTEEELNGNTQIYGTQAPVAPDRYEVYYQITAKNHKSYVDITDDDLRRTFVFYVVIVGEVDLPVMASKPFNGELQQADVPWNERYSVVANAGGVNADVYDVVLSLTDSELYLWKGQTLTSRTREITVSFEITQTDQNAWLVAPNIARWSYGMYDAAVNSPYATALYLDLGEAIEFTYYRSNPLHEKIGEPLIGVPTEAGWYVLVATVRETKNYRELTAEHNFQIFSAVNGWVEIPNIVRWSEGAYDEKVNVITASALHGTPVFVVYDEEGNIVNDLSELRAGTYTLTAAVEGTSNYSALESSITFTVFEKDSSVLQTIAITVGVVMIVAILSSVLIAFIRRKTI